jgi:hypothetical protein
MEWCTEKVVMVCSKVNTCNGVQKICNGLFKSKHMEWCTEKIVMVCSKVNTWNGVQKICNGLFKTCVYFWTNHYRFSVHHSMCLLLNKPLQIFCAPFHVFTFEQTITTFSVHHSNGMVYRKSCYGLLKSKHMQWCTENL